MTGPLVKLGLVALLLGAAVLALGRPDRQPAAAHVPRRLVAQEEQDALTVAAVSLAWPVQGREFLYGRRRGAWRCAQAFNALADEHALSVLFELLIRAEGTVRHAGERAAEYGFEEAEVVRVSFHGPKVLEREDLDVQLAFDVSPRGPEGSAFVRRAGSDEVWQIDRDPRPLTRSPEDAPHLPPMLDRRVLGGGWPGNDLGLRALFFDRADGSGVELQSRPVPEPEDGAPATRFVFVQEDGGEVDVPPYRFAGLASFLSRAHYDGVGNPAELAAFGLDEPFGRVTLVPAEGPALELAVSARDASGLVFCLNAHTQMVVQVPAEYAPLFVPDRDMLLDLSRSNPWEAWLAGR